MGTIPLMPDIEVKESKENATLSHFGKFLVNIIEGKENLSYEVTLDKDYWKRLTDEKIEPEVLIEKSFRFLLEREPKESILKSFNLKIISKYFPEYEKEII